MSDERSDEELLRAIRDGDSTALDTFYERHHRLALGLAYRIVRDAATAEDVVQEAYLAVWRGTASYDSRRGNGRSWLLAVVHHRAIDYQRRQARRPVTPLEVGEEGSATEAWNALQAERERLELRDALALLSADQRQLVELAYFAGLTQAEIVERTGVPLGTVKGRMRRALERLRTALGAGDTVRDERLHESQHG